MPTKSSAVASCATKTVKSKKDSKDRIPPAPFVQRERILSPLLRGVSAKPTGCVQFSHFRKSRTAYGVRFKMQNHKAREKTSTCLLRRFKSPLEMGGRRPGCVLSPPVGAASLLRFIKSPLERGGGEADGVCPFP